MLGNEGKWGPTPDVLWLRLMDSNEGVNDIVGTNDGTLNGGMGYGSGGGRRYAVFDGTDDNVSVPHFSALNFGTGSFSIAFWMQTSDTGYKFIIDKQNGPQFAVMINNGAANKLDFYQFGGGSSTYRTSSATVNDGAWHHIACVRAASTAPSIYVDGSLSNGALVDNGVQNVSNTGNLFVGKYGGGGFHPAMNLDDLRIFSRALSAAEVARLARIY